MAILEEHVGDGPASEGFGIWQQFTVRDGLPDMKIESLFEDSDGAMWIGTHDRGVVRYDGYEFETFSRGEGIGGDGVFSILQDPDGDMWFGTNTGITRYDGERFEQIEFGEACSFLWGSCVDDQGNLLTPLLRATHATPRGIKFPISPLWGQVPLYSWGCRIRTGRG